MASLTYTRDGAPRRFPLVGHGLAMREDPLAFFQALFRQHGGVAPIHVGPAKGVVVSDPEVVGEVLVKQQGRYTRKTLVYEAMAGFLGRGILNTEGDSWRRHRRIVQPGFHKRRLASFTDAIVAITETDLARWRGEVDASALMMRLTLRVVSEVMLGTRTESDASAIGEAIDIAQRYTEAVIVGGFELPDFVPTRRRRTFRRAVETLDRVAYGIIDERRESGERGDDVVSMLLDATYEDGSPLPRKQIRDELITLMVAGHETTSNALAWTLMRLSQHPEVARQLRAEVDEVLGGRSPSFEDLPKLRYTRWVLDEVMRLHPPAPTTGRLALEPHTLGGHPLAAGDLALISFYLLHRNPEVWDNPEGFDPARWEALSEPGALPRYAFAPFGAGTRKCVGEAFAYLEATIILAMIAQRYELHLTGRPVIPALQITLGVADGLWMRVVPRSPTEANVEAAQ
jgi:cytochrome P450